MLRCVREQRGSVAVMFAAALIALTGFAAIVIDVGMLYLNRVQLSNMVDAAALAGATQFLPDASSTPYAEAQLYAQRNGRRPGDMVTITVDNTAATISVRATRTVNLFLAPILGLSSSQVAATATATAGALSAATGVMPFGVEKQQFTYGESYILKAAGGSGDSGNYGALALGGSGAKVYEYNIINGYSGTLRVGDKVSTEPGNMSGPTNHGIAERVGGTSAEFPPSDVNSPRVVVIPVLETLDVNGRKDVTIVGFANFFLEDCGGSGNSAWVKGRFMKLVKPGETISSANNYFGAYNVRLISPPSS